MARRTSLLAALVMAGSLASCEEDGIIRASDDAATEQTGDVTLGDIRNMVNEPRDQSVPDGPQVDPAAANINPFKYQLEYNYKEREVLDGLLEQARDDGDYYNRSLAATQEGLEALNPQILWQDYLDYMSCAVIYDLSAREGLSSASAAQAKAAEFINYAMDPEIGSRPESEMENFRTARADLLANETAREKYAREQVEEEELNKIRTRNYLNYFLMRDRLSGSMDSEELAVELAGCEASVG